MGRTHATTDEVRIDGDMLMLGPRSAERAVRRPTLMPLHLHSHLDRYSDRMDFDAFAASMHKDWPHCGNHPGMGYFRRRYRCPDQDQLLKLARN